MDEHERRDQPDDEDCGEDCEDEAEASQLWFPCAALPQALYDVSSQSVGWIVTHGMTVGQLKRASAWTTIHE